MKKRVVFILALFVILSFLPSLYAVEFEINQEYSLGETIIARIAGNFTSVLTKSNIFFYEGHSRIPMQYDVVSIGNEYYLYVILAGKSEGNYSVYIKNMRYFSGTVLMEDEISRNFSISNKIADFYISPGALSASGDFSIAVQNLKNSTLSVSVKTSAGSSGERKIFIMPPNSTTASFSIASGQKKEIAFEPGIGNKTLRFIEIKNTDVLPLIYKIPAYIWGIIGQREKTTFFIEPSSISYSFYVNSTERKEIYLYNTGSSEIKDVNLTADKELSAFLNLSKTKLNLPANSKVAIGMVFFSTAEKSAVGNIEAKTADAAAYSSLSINFVNPNPIIIDNPEENITINSSVIVNQTTNVTSNGTINTTNVTNINSNQSINTTVNVNNMTSNPGQVIVNKTQIQSVSRTCSELKGEVCSSSEICSQEPVYAKDNLCCLADCQEIKKDNSGTFIAAGIIVFILLIGLWFFVKFKRTKSSPVNLLNVARGKN
jgi:hypothetical protein